MSDSTQAHRLFAAYMGGEISADQLLTLEAVLREDAGLRQEFIEYMNVDSALGDLAALSEAELAEIEAAEIEDNSTTVAAGGSMLRWPTANVLHRSYRGAAVVGVIAGSLLLAAYLWVANPSAEHDAAVATLVTGVDSVLALDGEPWSDAELAAGEYQLKQGLVHLQFAGGVMVYVEAPARFEAVSEQRVVLHGGRLSASVPPAGVGFQVGTPEAEVVDYGTEFSVDVESGKSEVHVFDGLVRVHPRSGTDDDVAIDLRTSQAVRIERASSKPVEIELATDRFIRTFDEPKRKYAHAVKELSPVAYYRMPIRDKGLVSDPPRHSGKVLTGDGSRPPHAQGVFAGGSLRVGADSTGRGGRVDFPPPLATGLFTLAVCAYSETRTDAGVVATDICGNEGRFALSLDADGLLHATVRTGGGEWQSVSGDAPLPLKTWRHLIVTADGEQLRLYEDGQLVASTQCGMMASSESETVWLGTDADGSRLWDGRIDELAFFDRAVSAEDVAALYQAAQEEMSRSD